MALLRGRKIGFVFQSYQLDPDADRGRKRAAAVRTDGRQRPQRIATSKRARELLESVGLLDRRDHYPIQLSGGEQQRVALARAFMVRPPILLADEPTGNLDTQNGQHVLELLISLNQREGTTLVLVTHDPALSSRASRRITLRDGRIVSDEREGNRATFPGPLPQDRLARIALVVVQVSVRDSRGRGRRRIAHRRARIQPRVSRHAAEPGPHADGGRPFVARVRTAHATADRRDGRAREVAASIAPGSPKPSPWRRPM